MQCDRPLLTIAIPTYNRSKYLAALLATLAPQLVREPLVELLISDNASPDDTSCVVSAFLKNGLRCRYVRNNSNIGADANFMQCLREAAGRYLWILGDDDIVLDGCVSQVVAYITKDEYDLLYLAPYGFDGDPIVEFQPDPLRREADVIESADLFVRKIGTMFSLISCNILNKERLLAIEHKPFKEFTGTNLIQLSWTFPLLTNFSKGLYIYHRFLAIRNGTSGGYSVTRVFGRNLKDITDELLPYHKHLARLIYWSAMIGFLPFAILKIRQNRHGDFELEDFHKELKPVYGKYFEYWFYVFPVAKLPLSLARAWYFLLRRVNNMRSIARLAYRLINRKFPAWRLE